MSIHFGSNEDVINTTQSIVAPWDAYYVEPKKNLYCQPFSGNAGYPISWMFGGWINHHSAITLISHIFDDDNTITTLRLRYTLSTVMRDGTEQDTVLKDIDMTTKKIPNRNYFALNETFNISETVTNWQYVMFMYVKFMQLSDETYGNESNLSLVVIHHV